jgi:hypothetical protein
MDTPNPIEQLHLLPDPELRAYFEDLLKLKRRGDFLSPDVLREYDGIQQDAFGIYWARRNDSASVYSAEEFDELLCWLGVGSFGVMAERVLGSSAMQGLLSLEQCLLALQLVGHSVAASQLLSRILLDARAQPPQIIFAVFIELGCTWAALELLPQVDRDKLQALVPLVQECDRLTRSEKHQLREAIRHLTS